MTKTGKIGRGVGYGKPNSNDRPTVYMDKYYPVKGRTDFYKWIIWDNCKLARDIFGEVMYFEQWDIKGATRVVMARRRVNNKHN